MQINRLPFISITRAIACATVLSCFLVAPARPQEVKAGDLVITQTWSRATPGGAKVAGGYLTIDNKGSAPDRLIPRSAELTDKIQVPRTATNNAVMSTPPLTHALPTHPPK